MIRTALVWTTSLSLAVAVACGPMATRPGGGGPIGNQVAPEPRAVLPDGDYACTITSGEYTYQPYRCRVTTVNGQTRLEKLEGSQRVRGTVTFDAGEGFRFEGEFYCDGGGCERPVDAAFVNQGEQTWGAPIGNDDSLQLVYVPGGMYGGAGYGGGMYGDDGYGGDGYGDSGYGGFGYGGFGYGFVGS